MCCVSLYMPGKWASELMRILLPMGSGDGTSGPHNRTGLYSLSNPPGPSVSALLEMFWGVRSAFVDLFGEYGNALNMIGAVMKI